MKSFWNGFEKRAGAASLGKGLFKPKGLSTAGKAVAFKTPGIAADIGNKLTTIGPKGGLKSLG